MKFKDYNAVLKARGYTRYQGIPYVKYKGQNMFEKKHKYNVVHCYVSKDSHGKAYHMSFFITSQLVLLKDDPEKAKLCKQDYEFLLLEANEIYRAFEELKKLKSPKAVNAF